MEDIQDLVEQGLVARNKFHLAKTYIIYRYTRALVRKANTTDESILSLIRNATRSWRRRTPTRTPPLPPPSGTISPAR